MPDTRPAITTIFFDIGGVLVNVEIQPLLEKISRATGLRPEIIGQGMDSRALHALERGEITFRDYYDTIITALGCREALPYDEFRRLWLAVLQDETEVARHLPDVRKQVSVWLLSNTNHLHLAQLTKKYRFMAQVDGLIVSNEVGHRKPETEIYRTALQHSSTQAQGALFIDDREDNVLAAQALGIHAHRFVDWPQLRDWLGQNVLAKL